MTRQGDLKNEGSNRESKVHITLPEMTPTSRRRNSIAVTAAPTIDESKLPGLSKSNPFRASSAALSDYSTGQSQLLNVLAKAESRAQVQHTPKRSSVHLNEGIVQKAVAISLMDITRPESIQQFALSNNQTKTSSSNLNSGTTSRRSLHSSSAVLLEGAPSRQGKHQFRMVSNAPGTGSPNRNIDKFDSAVAALERIVAPIKDKVYEAAMAKLRAIYKPITHRAENMHIRGKALFFLLAETIIRTKRMMQAFGMLEAEATNDRGEAARAAIEARNMVYARLQSQFNFDVENFRMRTGYQGLTAVVRNVLKKPSEQRTSSDISLVLDVVNRIKAFQRYPLEVRRQICLAATFQSFGADRTLIRQGHPGSSFYFITLGTVVVTAKVMDSGTSVNINRVLNRLNEGDSFGELALMRDNEVRSATITTETYTELIKLDRDDFQQILSESYTQTLDQKFNFLRKVHLLNGWSDASVRRLSEVATRRDFAAGTVAIDERFKSDYLYFIQSGTCYVVESIDVIKRYDFVSGGHFSRNYTFMPFVPGQQLGPRDKHANKIVHLATLSRGSHFGEGDLFTRSKREAITDSFQEYCEIRRVSVVTERRVECLAVSKIDFVRACSADNFDLCRIAYRPLPPSSVVREMYFDNVQAECILISFNRENGSITSPIL